MKVYLVSTSVTANIDAIFTRGQSLRKHNNEITSNQIDRWQEKSSFQRNEIPRLVGCTWLSFPRRWIASHTTSWRWWCNLKWSIVQEDRGLDISLYEIRLVDHPVDTRGVYHLMPAGFLADGYYVYACACMILRVEQCTRTISGRTNTQRGNELVTRLSGWE